jgi:Mg-chelatase subunit ChlD
MYLPFQIKASLVFTVFFVASHVWALDEDAAEVTIESAGEVITDTLEAHEVPPADEIEIPASKEVIEEVLVDDITPEYVTTDEIEDDAQILIKKDVVLVLDNSGSMKKNDPQFLTSQAVTQFITGLDEVTRVAIVIFDQDVQLAVPLTDVSLATRETILGSLKQINYKGLFTDSPAGIERAIYELKINGRDEAQKLIIFMTDGIVDTGDTNRDLEKAKWLKEELAADAADTAIKIFGIAFTDDADFELIQSLAQNTDGEYYRALQPEDLQNVFKRINKIINTPPEPEPVPEPPPVEPQPVPEPVPVEPVAPSPPPPPVIIEVPVQPTQAMGEEERIRSIIILVAAGILIIALLAILILLLRRTRYLKTSEDEYVQEAYLNDINGYTDKPSHKLGNKPSMMGRVAGGDSEHLDYIVIPESTIGRRHALIEYKDYSFWIIDQGSINGTFVNDQPVSTEIRLKHGDRIRLHKCEFEFSMPEMEDSGKTMISNTVMAEEVVDHSEDVTAIRGGHEDMMDLDTPEVPESAFDLDVDITGARSEEPTEDQGEKEINIQEMPDEDEDIPMDFDIGDDTGEFESGDETIMLDEQDETTTDNPEKHFDDDDATLRPDDD